MKQHPYILACILGVAVIAAATSGYAVFVAQEKKAADPGVEIVDVEAGHKVLAPEDVARLPADREVLAAAEQAECRGVVVSGKDKWGVKELSEKSVLWDESNKHLVVLLPNDQLAQLQKKLTPK